MINFASKFRPGSSSGGPGMSVGDVMGRLGGKFSDYQWLADPGNQVVDAFLGGAMLSFDPNGQLRSGIDPNMVNAIRGMGLQQPQIAQILKQRQALASGNSQAFMDADGNIQMVDRSSPLWGTDLVSRVFAPGSGAYNPVEAFLGGNPMGGPTPQAGTAPGVNGYTTADMVTDPVSGQMIPRTVYTQRYGQQNAAPQGQRPMGREGWTGGGTGGAGAMKPKSPFGATSFGGGFGGKSSAYQGFGNPAGRARYERKS